MLLITLSLIGGFPLIAGAVRNSISALIFSEPGSKKASGLRNSRVRRAISTIIFLVICVGGSIAIMISPAFAKAAYSSMDISQILFGNFVNYTFSGMMYNKAKKNKTCFERIMVQVLIWAGPIFSILGGIDFFMG